MAAELSVAYPFVVLAAINFGEGAEGVDRYAVGAGAFEQEQLVLAASEYHAHVVVCAVGYEPLHFRHEGLVFEQ